jgi:hypothetical protein
MTLAAFLTAQLMPFADEHLREDVAPGAEGDQAALQDGDFVPGQTNAG